MDRNTVLGVTIQKFYHNDFFVHVALSETAAKRAVERFVDGQRPAGFQLEDVFDDYAISVYDRETGSTVYLGYSEHVVGGWAATVVVCTGDDLDGTLELRTITLDDRLRVAAVVRKLLA